MQNCLSACYNSRTCLSNQESSQICPVVSVWLSYFYLVLSLCFSPAVLSSLRLLSTSTSILSDPSLVPEQAVQAVTHGHSSHSYSQWQHTLSKPHPIRTLVPQLQPMTAHTLKTTANHTTHMHIQSEHSSHSYSQWQHTLSKPHPIRTLVPQLQPMTAHALKTTSNQNTRPTATANDSTRSQNHIQSEHSSHSYSQWQHKLSKPHPIRTFIPQLQPMTAHALKNTANHTTHMHIQSEHLSHSCSQWQHTLSKPHPIRTLVPQLQPMTAHALKTTSNQNTRPTATANDSTRSQNHIQSEHSSHSYSQWQHKLSKPHPIRTFIPQLQPMTAHALKTTSNQNIHPTATANDSTRSQNHIQSEHSSHSYSQWQHTLSKPHPIRTFIPQLKPMTAHALKTTSNQNIHPTATANDSTRSQNHIQSGHSSHSYSQWQHTLSKPHPIRTFIPQLQPMTAHALKTTANHTTHMHIQSEHSSHSYSQWQHTLSKPHPIRTFIPQLQPMTAHALKTTSNQNIHPTATANDSTRSQNHIQLKLWVQYIRFSSLQSI